MPPRPFTLSFGPFDRGLMNGLDPALLPPGAAQTATNVDLSAGTLRGIYTPSATPETTATTYTQDLRGIFFHSNYAWLADTLELWGLADYDITNSVATSYTNDYSGANPDVPQRWDDGSSTAQMVGLDDPVGSESNGDITAASNSTPAGLTINKRYAVTYLYGDTTNTGLGWESNPRFSAEGGRSTTDQIQVEAPISADTRVTGRNVYCTNNGDPNGPLYLYHTFTDNTTTSFTDTLGTNPTGILLDWAEEGGYDTPPYLFDHLPAPVLSLLSDSTHSAVPGVTAPGGGIVLAAKGQVAHWSQAGFPERWPKRNRWSAPEAIRAILSHNAQSLLFTGSGVYSITGTDDNNLSFSKLAADGGVRAACGKTVCRTPFGVVYLSRQGLMLLTGDGSEPFLRDALSPDFWQGLTVQATTGGGLLGASYGRHYYIFGGDKTVILDFTHWPTVAVSTSDLVITAAHVTQFDGAGSGQGLYVAKHSDRDGSNHPYIRPWMYDNANARGVRAAWIWKTGRLATVRPGSSQAADKKGAKLHLRKTGTPTVKIYYDGSLVSTRTLGTGIGEGSTWIWLPTGYWKYLEIQIEGAGASDEVFGFDVEGAVFDAA